MNNESIKDVNIEYIILLAFLKVVLRKKTLDISHGMFISIHLFIYLFMAVNEQWQIIIIIVNAMISQSQKDKL